jgi:twitching motility protein PilI
MGRLNRREFQQNLSARLAQAERGELGQSLLAVESGADDLPGGRRWLIDLAESGEVVPLPPLTPAPLTRPWFAGVANIRGALYSVVDFAAWRGGLPTPRNAQARVLLIGARHGSNSALLVECALGLRPLSAFRSAAEASLEPVSLGHHGERESGAEVVAPWLGAQLIDSAGQRWMHLEIATLLVTPAWVDIAL